MSLNQKFIVAIAAVIAAPVLLVVIFLLSTNDIERQISGPVTIGPGWTDIRPTKPLKVSRHTQSINIYVSDAHEENMPASDPSGKSWAMRFPDGSVARPEVEVLDQYGNLFRLDSASFLVKEGTVSDLGGGMGFSTGFNVAIDSNFPPDRVYPLVRIRSDKPIRVSKVTWFCHTGK